MAELAARKMAFGRTEKSRIVTRRDATESKALDILVGEYQEADRHYIKLLALAVARLPPLLQPASADVPPRHR